jgi:Na+/melibiose symporter-like transporter
LDARLASFAALIGVIWDAINDPIVGTLSDRMKSRWGRRRPFLLFFTIPFAFGFLALWYAPPFESQIALMLYCMFAYMLSDTLQTLVVVPYYSLMPEVAPGYDQRTSVTGYRMVFNLLASLAVAVLGPMIVKSTLSAGFSQQQGYLMTAALFGGLATIPMFLIFATVRERFADQAEKDREVPFRQSARTAWQNVPSGLPRRCICSTGSRLIWWVDAAVLPDVLDRAG